MNILVWSSWVARPVGGQERFALGLALQLKQRGHHVVLVGAYDNAEELRSQIPANLPYYFFDFHRPSVKPHFAAARLLDRVVRDHRIEVVTAHGNIFALHFVCRRHNIPLVWTVHGATPRPPGVMGRLKTAALGRVLADARTHVVAISNATAEITHQQFPKLSPKHLHVIYPLHGLHEEALAQLPLPTPGPVWDLAFIGRLVDRKRPLDLVEVARELDPVLDFRLHVFGDGPLLQPLRAAIEREGLDSRFVLHGYWDKGSPGMVEQFQILVHTDHVEPFGTVVLEAQWGGRPVVAYNVGGIPEIVEQGVTGWLVPVKDTKALAQAVCTVTKNFTELATAARQRVMKRFTVTGMLDRYEEVFLQAVRLRPTR